MKTSYNFNWKQNHYIRIHKKALSIIIIDKELNFFSQKFYCCIQTRETSFKYTEYRFIFCHWWHWDFSSLSVYISNHNHQNTCLTSTLSSKEYTVCLKIIPAIFCCALYCIIWTWVPEDFPRSFSSTAVVFNLTYSYPSLFISFWGIWSRKTSVFIMNIILQVVREQHWFNPFKNDIEKLHFCLN